MKIDRSKIKKGTSEVPEDCRKVIDFLKTCNDDELLSELEKINVWYFGKCELYHWIDVLDRFDTILASIAKPVEDKKWVFKFDVLEDTLGKEKGVQQQNLIFQILKFTALLIEHSYARHLYNSIEHLITLLDCADGNIILAVLNLVYVFSKRSNYLSRLASDSKKILQEKLVDLAQTWGGLEAGCALEQCCSEDVPTGAGSVYFEYYLPDDQVFVTDPAVAKVTSTRSCIDLKNVHQMARNVGVIMENILNTKRIPENMQMTFYHRLRLAHAMANYDQRLQFVQARLQALSILVYSNATVHVNTLVYDGLIEEIVNTLKLEDPRHKLSEVKSSCLKTLTAIIHLDRNPRLQSIIDATGAMSYHGFLPSLVRQCILHMTNSEYEAFPQQLATSLFSFLYHLASYESGCEALVASGLIESLLKVVHWPGKDDHITFVTRAVRVIDLITNLDMAAFQTHDGLNALVGRLEREVALCSAFHGPALSSELPLVSGTSAQSSSQAPVERQEVNGMADANGLSVEDIPAPDQVNKDTDVEMTEGASSSSQSCQHPDQQCLPQRAALLKSILNFLKKAIPDPAFADLTRSLMDENLQNALKMVISNSEYYGALLFLLATDVITVFIFHEPSLLSSLQESGLTWVVLKALIVKDVPATRENLASLPNTLSALCLNARGLEAFVSCKPFDRLFRILISPEYLPAMKRRRSPDPTGDTAMHLGSAMDELMRHQPTLKTDAMEAIIRLLEQLGAMGRDQSIIAFHPTDKMKTTKSSENVTNASASNEEPLSDDEMEEEYRSLLIRKSDQKSPEDNELSKSSERKFVPVVDYVLNVTKFLDNILSNNGTDDHCVEFVRLGGLQPLYGLLNMPNFPLEFPLMAACQFIAQVCKSITMLAQESKVFKQGHLQLEALLDELNSYYVKADTKGSALLKELANTDNPLEALYDASKTPLVHAMSTAHAYVNAFVFISRGALSDVRNMSIQQWGSYLGVEVIQKLCNLYTQLVWESSVLLTLCTPEAGDSEKLSSSQEDLEKLKSKMTGKESNDGKDKKETNHLTLLRWLLTSSSHLGRALAELFGLLVHHCVGTQTPRIRRHNLNQPAAPSIPARMIATHLTKLLVQGLSWKCPEEIPISRLRLTFYICAVGFSNPMLFDNSKNPYHLMLQQFENVGGLDALFNLYKWVLAEFLDYKTVDEIKSIVGIREFLEGWLDLVNRMVNTKYVFESTHPMPANSIIPAHVPFDSIQYLVRVHKLAFEAVMLLWKYKVLEYSDSHTIAKLMLSILCHIIKGEKELKEKMEQQDKLKDKKDEPKKNAMSEIQKTPAPTTFQANQVNEAYLQQFVDMGFSQRHAHQALVHSGNNLESATEYLLTIPDATTRGGQSSSAVSAASASGGMEVDLSEEDMMIQAIAMSLGQNVNQSETNKEESEGRKLSREKLRKKLSSEDKKPHPITLQEFEDFSSAITNSSDDIIAGCLNLVDCIPSAVHPVCDLLLAVSKRSGSNLHNSILYKIIKDILQHANFMKEKIKATQSEIQGVKDPSETRKVVNSVLCEGVEPRVLTTRLHLYLLMFQELEMLCSHVLQEKGCFVEFIDLLEATTQLLKTCKDSDMQTPEYLAPLLLIFDHYEKAALFWKRQQNQKCSHTWKWFDDRSGRWCNYSISNNTSIDTAYHARESAVRFTAGRRRYMVFFKTLVQINEDTGNRRPIMLDVLQGKKPESAPDTMKSGKGQKRVESGKELELRKTTIEKLSGKSIKRKREGDSQMNNVDKMEADDDKQVEEIFGLYQFQKELIIESSVELIGFPANANTLNAVIRVALRLTRDFEIACYFANQNGVENLLKLKESSSFPGAIPLITLLLRHIVENQYTLKTAVERAVAVAASNGVPNMFCGVGQNSLGAKELHYLLRALGSIACRNPDLYNDTVKKVFRLVLPSSRRGQLEEMIPPNASQIVKSPAEMKMLGLNATISTHAGMEKFIHLLLNTLVERHLSESETSGSNDNSHANGPITKTDIKKKPDAKIYTPQATLVRRLTGEHIDEEDMTAVPPKETQTDVPPSTDEAVSKNNDPLVSEAIILRLLTELAKSYIAVASLITDFSLSSSAGGSKPKFDGSVLSFVFDYLLPHTNKEVSSKQDTNPKDAKPSAVSTLARSLLSVLGAYWHNADILNTFVTELKSALIRALQLPECRVKHIRLQSLFNLITSMIETAAPISFSSHPPVQNGNFIKLLIKRGLISDLARCTHNLDLSSKDLVSTVNVMLKPLEKLSNLANSQSLQSGAAKSDKAIKPSASTVENLTESRATGSQIENVQDSQETRDGDNFDSQGGATGNNAELQDLDDIVEVMLGSNDNAEIFGETLMTEQGGTDDGVEQRIYIEANPMVGNSDSSDSNSSSSDSDNDDGGLSDNISEGNDYPENHEPMVEDRGVDDHVVDDSTNVGPSADQIGEDEENIDGDHDQALTATFNIIADAADLDDTNVDEAFIMERGDDDGEQDGLLGGDEEEDDTDDEEGNNDDDEGSEMDADDTIAGADDALLFGNEDETADSADPFADLDDQNGTVELNFPRRSLYMPQVSGDGIIANSVQSRSSILSHPLLLRSSEPVVRATNSQNTTRGRSNRRDRAGFTRQGNTIHVHGTSNSGSFARILIGEDLRQGNRNSESGVYTVGDDLFFDIFGDGNETSSGLLNSVPSALSRWTVESRLLDGSSVHDCVNALKPEIVSYLEKIQKDDLKEKVAEEKRKKEEIAKKKAQLKAKENSEKLSASGTVAAPTSTASSISQSLLSATNAITSADSTTDSTSTEGTRSAGEAMDITVSGGDVNPVTTVVTTAASLPATNAAATLMASETFATPAIPARSNAGMNTNPPRYRVSSSAVWTPPVYPLSAAAQGNTPSNFITPHNPFPEVLPNAPNRDAVGTSQPADIGTPADGPSSDTVRSNAANMASLLGVVPDNTPGNAQTPIDVLRLNQQRNANAAALTGDLGFTPFTNINSPQADVPDASSMFATPANVPSLQQLRNSLMFSQGSTPRGPHLASLTRVGAPSPLVGSIEAVDNFDNVENAADSDTGPPVSGAGNSALAADLAAAIMSQLMTSSPTPTTTNATQTVDATPSQPSSSVTATSDTTTSTSSQASSEPGAIPASNETANVESQSRSTPAEPGPGPSGVLRAAEQIQRELENLGIPEGVDPSFLAALPENIREEVLREQFGIRLRAPQDRVPQAAASAAAADSESAEPQEVSPEFLAALPPDVQQEVLEQQRLEQARFSAAQQRPEDSVDPAEFVRNLNPTLRRQVLADMDDSVLAVLPTELSTEAQGLRREIEQRRMQLQTERITRNDFSQLLRHTGLAHRTPDGGFQFARLFPRGQMNPWRVTDGPVGGNVGNKKVGRQLLDPESLTCLLVLLFLNDSTLNASRLHRILRNLSYHNLTKQWIIIALISILRRTSSFHQESSSNLKLQAEHNIGVVKPKSKKQKGASASILSDEVNPMAQHIQWLSRTLNLAFGGCVNIFQLQKVGKKSTDCFVTVHQQACLDVCKQTLEALSFLAKNFPSSFAPQAEDDESKPSYDESGPSQQQEYGDVDHQSEFWDILVRLNASSSGLKGKAPSKTLREFPKEREGTSFVTSPLGHILSMLSHPVVKQSTMLTDKLLRLLAVISMSLPERPKHLQAQTSQETHESSPDARPPDSPHPIHTVTFAPTDDVLSSHNQPVLHGQSLYDDREQNAAEVNTICSETTSVTSSLFVEHPDGGEGRMLLQGDVRSPVAGSVMSALSDGTVAQSDISGITAEQIREEHDVMDVDNTSQPISDTSSIVDHRSSPALSLVHMSPEKEPPILIGQLRMAVNVLTTGTCSDEGLEDATTLLLQLSRTEPLTRDCILELLLEGAQETANVLRDEIKALLSELKEHNASQMGSKTADQSKSSKQSVPVIVNPASARSQPWRGRGGRAASQTRRFGGFGPNQHSRRNVPKPVIYDLHLPTMAVLTAKRCNQSLYLRSLKVVLQLREAARKNAKKPQASRTNQPRSRGIRLIERLHHGGSSLREFVAALEADMEAMYEMIDRFNGQASNLSSALATQEQRSTASGGDQASGNASSSSSSATASGAAEGVASSSVNAAESSSDAATAATASSSSNAEGDSSTKTDEPQIPQFSRLSTQLSLDELWEVLGEALTELAETSDTNAVLVLQPAVEAFFLVHGSDKDDDKTKENAETSASDASMIVPPSPGPYSPGTVPSPSGSGKLTTQNSIYSNLPPDTQKFLKFAETHRTVLNQILRQSSTALSEGPFAVLANHTRLLDFDVKRRYFRQELEKEDKGHRREDMAVHIRRDHVFEDSYRELHRRTQEELKNRLYIVFDGEEGQDAGGLLREWYGIMAREMFNPNYALFTISQGEKATYLPNRNSHCNPNHLSYFKFAGRIVAKAIYDNKLLDCYFTRSFYKHILGKAVHYTDMEAEDYGFYQGLVYLLEHDIDELGYELTFSLEMQVFGLNEIHDLKANGRNIPVSEETKREYVKLVCQEKMTGSIRQQIDSFLEGFYEIIPSRLISIFDEQELELLVAGLPTIDIEDLKANTEYHKYTENSLQIQWFWRALRSFEQADRAKFLQFVTGTSKVPLQGFATLEGMNGVQKFQIHRDDRSTDRLPCAHTCFNQLDLPAYETYDKLHAQLLKAIQECPEGFGLA